MRSLQFAAAAVLSAMAFTTPAAAIPVPNGTVSVANLFTPEVDITSSPSTYSVAFGTTVQVAADGGFASSNGLFGTFNGTINFSNVVGTTIEQSIPSLFKFIDGLGGMFDYSLTSITTRTFSDTPGVSTSISLLGLGTVTNSNLNYEPTLAGLTISFNRTGTSAFSSSETLAVPPVDLTPVPEPGMLMLFGLGAVGLAFTRRRTR